MFVHVFFKFKQFFFTNTGSKRVTAIVIMSKKVSTSYY